VGQGGELIDAIDPSVGARVSSWGYLLQGPTDEGKVLACWETGGWLVGDDTSVQCRGAINTVLD